MKSYAEFNNKIPFDWNKFLNKKKYSEDELGSAKDAARSWVTCACGSQCHIIPRDQEDKSRPLDSKLYELGLDFYNAIQYMQDPSDSENTKTFEDNKETAIETLQQIELRSSILIKHEIRKRVNILKSTILELEDVGVFYTIKKI